MRRLLPAALLLGLVGCGRGADPWPELHSASGTVSKGGRPVPKALVRFTAGEEQEQKLTVSGVTDDHGRFTLGTIKAPGREKKSGAPAGTYAVTVMLPMDENQSGGGAVELQQPYTVKPGDNSFTIELAPKR